MILLPRFKVEYVDGSKAPTSYIATYIGKLDSRAVDGIDRKQANHAVTTKPENQWPSVGAPSAGRAFIGSASSSSLASPPVRCGVNCAALPARWHATEGPQRLKDDAMDAVLAAADARCFATYIEKQGGVLVPRKTT